MKLNKGHIKYTHPHRELFYKDFTSSSTPSKAPSFHPLGLKSSTVSRSTISPLRNPWGRTVLPDKVILKVHLTSQKHRQDLDKGFEIPHILASQSRYILIIAAYAFRKQFFALIMS
ncbi:hypothetical protein CDAR_91421 [Caerostris darwini]|uniref:Uncharacterized protein n=1 Tax=Caerostris darwini TaxID=1538125 RepID=A0AAV4Q979_9ARAC|nr:hypothetical protein CDAR_91421 [Caerostris darwini]